ncbi:hypothetical protein B0A48_07335 [Cryoendolithus antarcticus]|uniref:FAD-binding domain-containing protein n=1 Tax=Cryoendolithus antarcticus TaxID=1507870 RepID=A0A1V8T8S9_9PEZI|nr:hypothetical protein B0A48_07335 [Cryoendolithus antarcticus]
MSSSSPLRIAIIGGGPAGLGAAIALSELPNVEVKVYEKAKELCEVGAGIRIGFNCWRVLGLLGADEGVRGHHKVKVNHRNGLTGALVGSTNAQDLPKRLQPHRVRRRRLQAALLAQVKPGVIRLGKALNSVEDLGEGKGVKLVFEDGEVTEADLVVGGDGIRSVVRDAVYPDHTTRYTGTIIWRTLIPWSKVKHLPEIAETTAWWYGKDGHEYTSPVDDPEELCDAERMLEISCRNLLDPATDLTKRFNWGVPATNERVDYDPQVREAMAVAPEGTWREFSAFAGARLDKLTAWDKVVLLGDASHPLSGAFGSRAAFALEDGWILARAIEYTRGSTHALRDALKIFDEIRSPYYMRMYEFLDEQKGKAQAVKHLSPDQRFEAALKLRADGLNMESKMPWIYMNDIVKVWEQWIAEHEGPSRSNDRGSIAKQDSVLLDDRRAVTAEVSVTA